MTSSAEGTSAPTPPTPPLRPPTAQRKLRRSATDRIAGGVAGGLGEYFGFDPVLFRILFAVSAFFGGAGLIAYVIAWAVIPVAGTDRARVDGWLDRTRHHRIPPWAWAVLAGLALWGVAASWWIPRPAFWPVAIIVIAVLLLSRVERRRRPATPPPVPTAPLPSEAGPATVPLDPALTPPFETPAEPAIDPAIEAEAHAARERRRMQTGYLRSGALVALIATLTVLGICDAVGGIRLPAYFWVTGGIVLTALLIGTGLRRIPWSLTPLLVLSLAGIIAFGNTGASLHDGVGQKVWVPVTEADFAHAPRLAFGQVVVDLRHVALTRAHTVDVTQAAGQVRVLLPQQMNATVHAYVRGGHVDVTGAGRSYDWSRNFSWGRSHGGLGIDQTVPPPAGASGPPVDITIHLAAGNISVERG